MKNQTNQHQKTQGKTEETMNKKEQKQTNNTKLLNHKADVLTKLDYGRSYLQ